MKKPNRFGRLFCSRASLLALAVTFICVGFLSFAHTVRAGFWDDIIKQPNKSIDQATKSAQEQIKAENEAAANGQPADNAIDNILNGNPADQAAQKADNTPPAPANVEAQYKNCVAFNPTYLHGLADPLNGACIPELVKRIVLGIMSIAGAAFFVMFVYGGFLYMTAGGDSKGAANGQKVLTNAVIGILITSLSYILVFNVIGVLQNAQSSSSSGSDPCTAKGQGYSCMKFSGTDTNDAMSNASKSGYQCSGEPCGADVLTICCRKP